MGASYRYVSGPVRQRNHLPKVASRSLALSESVSLNRPDERRQTQVVDSWIREGDVRVVPWCSSTSDTRLKGATYEAISDDTCVIVVHPCRVMNYSNSHVRGYGLLGDLYLIIRQLEWILLKLAR